MKSQNKLVEFYKTKDHVVASLLYATGQTLESTEWQNGVCYFIFEDINECEDIISKYYKGLINLNAKAIFDGIKTIKSILYSR